MAPAVLDCLSVFPLEHGLDSLAPAFATCGPDSYDAGAASALGLPRRWLLRHVDVADAAAIALRMKCAAISFDQVDLGRVRDNVFCQSCLSSAETVQLGALQRKLLTGKVCQSMRVRSGSSVHGRATQRS